MGDRLSLIEVVLVFSQLITFICLESLMLLKKLWNHYGIFFIIIADLEDKKMTWWLEGSVWRVEKVKQKNNFVDFEI